MNYNPRYSNLYCLFKIGNNCREYDDNRLCYQSYKADRNSISNAIGNDYIHHLYFFSHKNKKLSSLVTLLYSYRKIDIGFSDTIRNRNGKISDYYYKTYNF